jgi:hypothetical protein
VSADIFNLLNSSGILAINTAYTPPSATSLWLAPTQILQGRLMKIGAQFDF